MSTSKACVPVYSAVTQPSGGLVFGAGQGLLDTDWTRPTRAGAFSPREGGHGGCWAAAYRRKDLVNLFHFSSGPTQQPLQAYTRYSIMLGICTLNPLGGVVSQNHSSLAFPK